MPRSLHAVAPTLAVMFTAGLTLRPVAHEVYREFRQVADGSEIRQARGSVISLRVASHDPVEATYYVSGEWMLNCVVRCENASHDRIMFDLSHSMQLTNESRPAHAHQYSQFRANSVTFTPRTTPNGPDDSKLTITGTITLHKTGSNESVGITVELFRPTTAGIFSVTLSGTTHIESTMGGVIVESER